MRQGRQSNTGHTDRAPAHSGGQYNMHKIEPRANAVSITGVSQIGSQMGNHATERRGIMHGVSKPMYAGRGFEAPIDDSVTIHRGGSQRRHS